MKLIKTSFNKLILYHTFNEFSTNVRTKVANELYRPLYFNIDRGISMIKRRELKNETNKRDINTLTTLNYSDSTDE